MFAFCYRGEGSVQFQESQTLSPESQMFRFVALVLVLLGSTSHKRGCGNQARLLMCPSRSASLLYEFNAQFMRGDFDSTF